MTSLFVSRRKLIVVLLLQVQTILLNGEDMLARCREQDAVHLREDLKRLDRKAQEARARAERRKVKLEEHLTNVRDFHAILKIHTEWLNNAEKILASFKFPSKLVERVTKQMSDHKAFRDDIEAHREVMQSLDRTGTYLKYFGRKQDTVYIKNLLISIKLRWKKLVRRAEEKGRLLQQAHKEDKRVSSTPRIYTTNCLTCNFSNIISSFTTPGRHYVNGWTTANQNSRST